MVRYKNYGKTIVWIVGNKFLIHEYEGRLIAVTKYRAWHPGEETATQNIEHIHELIRALFRAKAMKVEL
jgi:hypothetical protein